MPFQWDEDGTFATVPDGDRGRRIPTQANLDELAGGGGGGVTFPVDETGAADETVDLSISATVSGGLAEGHADRTVTGTGTAPVYANTTVTSDGDAYADTTATSSGAEDAHVRAFATTAQGTADVSRTAAVTDPVGGTAIANTTVSNAEGFGEARTNVTVGMTGEAAADSEANSVDGLAKAGDVAYATGDGNATVNNLAIVDGAGLATASIEANGSGGNAYVKVVADATSARIGFFQATPVVQPVIPATPDAQDIADVLVALGLASQAV